MRRPTKIQVAKLNDKYSITCVDEITGSATGMYIPINGYEALKRHFETGAMEVSSDELSNCTIDSVSVSLLADFLKYAIDETMRISGDYDGIAGTLFVDDTYEKIAADYISICNER